MIIELFRSADPILNVGVDAVEFGEPWRLEAAVIHIDALPNDSLCYPSEVSIAGRIAGVLAALVAEPPYKSSWDAQQLSDHRRALHAYIMGAATVLAPLGWSRSCTSSFPRAPSLHTMCVDS